MTKRRIGMEMESLAGVLDKGLQPAIECLTQTI